METNNQIKSIVVVGGGTAGWLSANFLNKALNGHSPTCKITLIESSDIPTVGVGEATIPTLASTLRFIGLSETEWMTKCNATFKQAIKFVNWSGKGDKDVFWHPFGTLPSVKKTGIPLSYFWLKTKFQGNTSPFDYSCFEHIELCEAQKSPKAFDDLEYQGKVEYAYHLDAGLLAKYLKEKGKKRGINHIVDNVLAVSQDSRGFITHVTTSDHGDIAGDLFIDCSGFRGLLINETLKEPFDSYSESLLCDSAIAMSMYYDEGDRYNENQGGINPYTTAHALSSGWTWNIPLVDRTGNGYVYSSAFITPEQAEAEFRQHLGPRSDRAQAKRIKMRIGKNRNTWVNNCVSIGLAGGFIEPLESTGIYLIEVGLHHLMHNFPNKLFSQSIINNYNRIMTEHYHEIRDYIVMHYYLSKRQDTAFWQATKDNIVIPDSLQTKLDFFAAMWPDSSENLGPLFPAYSYICILAGLGNFPEYSLPILDYQDDSYGHESLLEIRKKAEKLKPILPTHADYLKQIRFSKFQSLLQRTFAKNQSILTANSI